MYEDDEGINNLRVKLYMIKCKRLCTSMYHNNVITHTQYCTNVHTHTHPHRVYKKNKKVGIDPSSILYSLYHSPSSLL